MSLHQFSQPKDGRMLFGGLVDSVGALAAELIRPSERFVLFVAVDSCALPGKTLANVAGTAVRAGASYICCWGLECSRFHDMLAGASPTGHLAPPDERVILSACQQGRSLEQALGFAVHAAQPSPRLAASTRSVIAVAIANPAWASRIETCLAAGAPFVDES